MKKSTIVSMLLSVVAVIGIIFLVVFLNNGFAAKGSGNVTIEVKDQESVVLETKKIAFKKDDKLVDLVQANFRNVKMNQGMIMSILDYETPSDWRTFLMIYVNDEASNVGLLEITFKDKDKISFVITKYEG